LVDGGDIFIPNYGAWTGHEWVIEGRGAVPDYEVDQDPSLVMQGRDPQLDKTISLLLDELKAHPLPVTAHPPFPVKTGGSRSGG
jgi:tricorn protease